MSTIMIGEEIGTNKKIELGDIERRSGTYILGKPGMGKSNFIENAILEDILENGVFFLDPHGDSIKNILNYVSLRVGGDEIILFDPEDRRI